MKKLFMMLVALLLVVGCSSSNSSSDTLKIGANLELSGSLADYGNSEFEGVKLAIKVANENGGFKGKDIEFVYYDNKSDNTEAVSIHTKLLTMDNVNAAITPATSGGAAAVYPIADEYGVPTVAAAATAIGVTLDKDGNAFKNGFRVCFTDAYQGIGMAKFVVENLNAKKVIVIGDSSSDYALGLKESFSNQLKLSGGTIVAEESYVSGETDFSALLTKISSLDYDAIYIAGYYNEAGLIIRQARDQHINCPIAGGDGFDSPTLLDLAGTSALNDVYFTTAYTTVTTAQNVLDFVAAYKAEYNKEPDMFAALAYDAASLIIDAAKRADSNDSSAITKALVETSAYQGVTGSISFDSNHDAMKSVLVVKLVDGVQTDSVEVK